MVVAVIDSGCDMDHEDLKDNLIPGPNFVIPTSLPEDDCGHGTHCASLIAAENNEVGLIGQSPEAKVMVIKTLDRNGIGNLQTVAKAIRWAVDSKADIISMSLGCPNETPEIYKAVMYAYSQNVPIFCASGNSGNLNNIFWPANYKETISVSAYDENMHRAHFANVSPNINFFAPGTSLFGAYLNNDYTIMSGTSMACPIMASAAALILSYKRNYQTDIKLNSVEDYRDILKQYCKPISDNCSQGFGFFNPDVFLEWIKKQPV